jgi:putative selenate reductase
MAELLPIPFSTLLRRIHYEYARSEAIFDLPKRKFYIPSTSVDLSVVSCGNPAANPVGPAAGPHTQLAQNIVLSWLAGARIIELKTVQVNDRLALARPCIDIATIGYNTEWSQELRLDDSAREYVKASMIIEILKHWLFYSGAVTGGARVNPGLGINAPTQNESASWERNTRINLDTIFDVSVGYDLAGIRSEPIRRWLSTMLNASELIEQLRSEIPEEFAGYRDLPFITKISDSITLSTFHGTPADEIERICEFLLTEMGFHVVVKMNPPMLGKERLEQLLHGTLGYNEIEVNPNAYEVNISFDDAAAMMKRLQSVAARHHRTVGVKFGNTLEVLNKGTFLKDSVQYLSGQPLHVLHLALVDRWRKLFGAEFPISFSAGVDAENFADCVAIGLVPTTTCTDLLRPGGYGRLRQYLLNLERRMSAVGASTIDEFIARSAGTGEVFRRSLDNPRYRAAANSKPPRKIGSHLSIWDCLNCDKCIPVCPNDANFYFDVEPVSIVYHDLDITAEGWGELDGGVCSIKKAHQIGTYADACNECGNCDVFCPEAGGPYIEKPRFFSSLQSYREQATIDGFVLMHGRDTITLFGRFSKHEYELSVNSGRNEAVFTTEGACVTLDWTSHAVVKTALCGSILHARIGLGNYFVMAALLKGLSAPKSVNFVTLEFNHA